MSVQALSCAFAIRGISASEKLVLLALANFANEKMICWPSQERLAEDTELSDRTVWAALKGLEGRGLLSRQSRKRADGTRSTDVFTLHFSLIVTSEPVANPANSTRKSCEDQSQILRNPVARVATLTTFEPSPNRQLEEPVERAKSAAKARGARRVPENWSPSESHFAQGAEEGFSPGEIERELAKFRDWEFAKPRSDWDATFRNWLRTAAERNPRHGQRTPNVPGPDHKLAAKDANLARALAGADAGADFLAERRRSGF